MFPKGRRKADIDRSVHYDIIVNAGNNMLQQNGGTTGQRVNEYDIRIPPDNANDDGKGFGLPNTYSNVPSSPEYEVKASLASGSAYGASKILALAKPRRCPNSHWGLRLP